MKTTFIKYSSGEFKFGQKSGIQSQCTNMKIHTQSVKLAIKLSLIIGPFLKGLSIHEK